MAMPPGRRVGSYELASAVPPWRQEALVIAECIGSTRTLSLSSRANENSHHPALNGKTFRSASANRLHPCCQSLMQTP
jgi:hypothetical protein